MKLIYCIVLVTCSLCRRFLFVCWIKLNYVFCSRRTAVPISLNRVGPHWVSDNLITGMGYRTHSSVDWCDRCSSKAIAQSRVFPQNRQRPFGILSKFYWKLFKHKLSWWCWIDQVVLMGSELTHWWKLIDFGHFPVKQRSALLLWLLQD